MIDLSKYLSITASSLYAGLKNNWLSIKEVLALIDLHLDELNFSEEELININVNVDERKVILETLENKQNIDEDNGIRLWQQACLRAISESDLSITQKLKEIEMSWSGFNYPESWQHFIYYMPNEKANTETGLYQIFLNFLKDESAELNLDFN